MNKAGQIDEYSQVDGQVYAPTNPQLSERRAGREPESAGSVVPPSRTRGDRDGPQMASIDAMGNIDQ